MIEEDSIMSVKITTNQSFTIYKFTLNFQRFTLNLQRFTLNLQRFTLNLPIFTLNLTLTLRLIILKNIIDCSEYYIKISNILDI